MACVAEVITQLHAIGLGGFLMEEAADGLPAHTLRDDIWGERSASDRGVWGDWPYATLALSTGWTYDAGMATGPPLHRTE